MIHNYSSQWGLENNTLEFESLNNSSYFLKRMELLPNHLKEAIETNPEFKEYLMNIPAGEIRNKLLTGDVAGNVDSNILMELANEPVFFDTDDIDNDIQSQSAYLCDAGVTQAWEKSTGNGVTVAVIDTGVDISHEDLAENIWVNTGEIPNNEIDDDGNGKIDDTNGWNFSDDNNSIYDTSNINNENHGTHIAGIIAAVMGNGKGIAGVSPSAKI